MKKKWFKERQTGLKPSQFRHPILSFQMLENGLGSVLLQSSHSQTLDANFSDSRRHYHTCCFQLDIYTGKTFICKRQSGSRFIQNNCIRGPDRFIKSELKRHISNKGSIFACCPWLNTQNNIPNFSDIFQNSCTRTDAISIHYKF